MRKKDRLLLICLLFFVVTSICLLSVEAAEPFSIQAEKGDLVTFGTYPQSSENEEWTDIVWRVLENDGEKALLISEYCLASMPFHAVDITMDPEEIDISWKDSSLRSWLNADFYMSAFSEDERKQILETDISAPGIDDLNTPDETRDYVFLLSKDEVKEYFGKKDERCARATDFVENRDDTAIFVSDLTDHTVFWWLRSSGDQNNCTQTIGAEGSVSESGFLVSRFDIGVRPALWLE